MWKSQEITQTSRPLYHGEIAIWIKCGHIVLLALIGLRKILRIQHEVRTNDNPFSVSRQLYKASRSPGQTMEKIKHFFLTIIKFFTWNSFYSRLDAKQLDIFLHNLSYESHLLMLKENVKMCAKWALRMHWAQ